MIGNRVRVHYHTETVDSADQAVSLAEYLTSHGLTAFKETDDSVMVTMECQTEIEAADKERVVHMLVTTWEMFWEHSDAGVFSLPVYVKD